MKIFHLLFLIVFICGIAPAPSHANNYPNAVIGYLVDECRQALLADSHIKFHKSPCGEFLYLQTMWLTASYIKNHHAPAYEVKNKECLREVEAAQENWERNRLCLNNEGKSFFGGDFQNAYNIVAWGEWLKSTQPEMLAQPIFPHVLQTFQNGEFCEYRKTHNNYKNITISDELKQSPDENERMALRELEKDYRSKTSEDAVLCKKALTDAKGDSDVFATTECAFKMSAALADLFILHTTSADTPTKSKCREDIEGLYKHLILPTDMCLSRSISVLEFTTKLLEQLQYNPVTDEYEAVNTLSFCPAND